MTYTKRDGPERAEAWQMRDRGIPAEVIANKIGVSVATVFRWVRERPPAEPPVLRARRLVAELADAVNDLAATRGQAPNELGKVRA